MNTDAIKAIWNEIEQSLGGPVNGSAELRTVSIRKVNHIGRDNHVTPKLAIDASVKIRFQTDLY